MSDRSYFQLRIFEVSDGASVLSLLEEELEREAVYSESAKAFVEPDPASPIGKWVAEEMSLGYYEEIADQLIDADPNIVFECWNDPKYEWLGGYAAYTPDLGWFRHDCDSEGNPVFTAQAYKAILAEVGLELPSGPIATKLGIPWEDKFQSYRENR